MGDLVETISMYADDTLLYLADSGPSLAKVFRTTDHFGSFSGLKIKWEKSQVLPLDFAPQTELQAQLPLQ